MCKEVDNQNYLVYFMKNIVDVTEFKYMKNKVEKINMCKQVEKYSPVFLEKASLIIIKLFNQKIK